jgi:plasmid stabilization system protein ParE
MSIVRFVAAARIELDEAFDFYLAQGGRSLADAFLSEVQRVALMVALNPQYGKVLGEPWQCFHLRRFPYSLIYRQQETGIRIVAVAHQHRKPNYWAGRS